jgi:hypothetical protein
MGSTSQIRLPPAAGAIGGFLREPSGRGQQRAKPFAQEGIDRQIRRADWVIRGFFPYIQRLVCTALPRPAGHGNLARLGHDGAQLGVIDHRIIDLLGKVCN